VATATEKGGKLQEVPLDKIEIDGGTQMRARIDEQTAADYAELFTEGVSLPPAVVYFDGKHYWLADGFHRFHGSKKAGLGVLYCEVRKGTKADAQWEATAANQTHGLRRSNADKANAVKAALAHPKAARMSDRAVASHVGVSHEYVRKTREKLIQVSTVDTCPAPSGVNVDTSRIGRDGKTYPASQPPAPSTNGHVNGYHPDYGDALDQMQAEADELDDVAREEAVTEPEPENGRAKALAAYKAAEKALGAIQDNLLTAWRAGGRHPNPEGYAKGFFEIIQKGRASL
jgi:hypothetical protein